MLEIFGIKNFGFVCFKHGFVKLGIRIGIGFEFFHLSDSIRFGINFFIEFVIEKIIGFSIKKIVYRKKYQIQYRKSIGFGIEKVSD